MKLSPEYGHPDRGRPREPNRLYYVFGLSALDCCGNNPSSRTKEFESTTVGENRFPLKNSYEIRTCLCVSSCLLSSRISRHRQLLNMKSSLDRLLLSKLVYKFKSKVSTQALLKYQSMGFLVVSSALYRRLLTTTQTESLVKSLLYSCGRRTFR